MKQRENQSERILRLLQESVNCWVPLPRILDLRISQYSARVHELRRLGFRIQNKTEHRNGQVWSSFRLLEPGQSQLFEPLHSEQRGQHFLEPELSRKL